MTEIVKATTYISKEKLAEAWENIADILDMVSDIICDEHPKMAEKLQDFAKDFRGE